MTAENLLKSIGRTGTPVERSWTTTDVMLYALAVGAGQADAGEELALTTENSPETELEVLPSFACTLASAPWPIEFAPDMTKVLHLDEVITLHRPIPTAGTCVARMTVSDVVRHRSGALFHLTSEVHLATGEHLATIVMGLLVRGLKIEAEDLPDTDWSVVGDPTAVFWAETLGQQALLYRLTGDRNPLHSSPEFARRAGFDRPILHGLCTLGISTRLLRAHAQKQGWFITEIGGNFKRPFSPGGKLSVEAWADADMLRFRTVDDAGRIVIDKGWVRLGPGW